MVPIYALGLRGRTESGPPPSHEPGLLWKIGLALDPATDQSAGKRLALIHGEPAGITSVRRT
jgi:hypothetical protein